MATRVSSNQFMYNYQKTLNKSYQTQQKLFEQADGSSIHRSSDDPVAYAKVMRLRYTENENTQYTKNVQSALSWMKSSDNAIIDMKDNIKTFATKTNEAANDYNTDPDFKSIAAEMMAVIEDVVTNCNTQLGDRYVFAGQKDTTHPFVMSKDTYERGMAKTLDAKQAEFFKGATGDINAGLYQMLEMQDSDGNIYYFDTESGYVYEKDFVESGYLEVIAGDYGNVNATYSTTVDDDGNTVTTTVAAAFSVGTVALSTDTDGTTSTTFKVSDAFDSRGIVRDEIDSDEYAENNATVSYTLDTTTNLYKATGLIVMLNDPIVDEDTGETQTTLNLSFTTVNQRIVTYSGDTNHISMVKLNGPTDGTSDIVNVNGKDMWGSDIFDNADSGNDSSGAAMLNNLITVYAKTYEGDAHWLDSDGVTLSNVTHSTLNIAQTTLGARTQLYTAIDDMLETQSTIITEDITNLSGTDVAQLATKLMEHTTLYNLALSLGGRVLPQTLADYL